MAIRSILDVDVNDAQFQRFLGLFQQYQTRLAAMPGTWANIGGHIQGGAAALIAGAAAIRAQQAVLGNIASQHGQITDKVQRQAGYWERIRDASKSMAGHITTLSRGILHLGGELIGGGALFGGLLSVSGLFGMARLAGLGGGALRSTLGLGTTFGGQQAFGLGFGRLVDPGAILGGVSGAMTDVSRRGILLGLGLNPPQGADTASVAADVLMRVKGIADRTPEMFLSQMMRMYRLEELGFSLEDLRRIKSTPAKELRSLYEQQRLDKQKLQLTREELKTWQNLEFTLHRSRITLERTFLHVLGKRVAGAFENLVPHLTHLIEVFAQSPLMDKFFDLIGRGVDWLTGSISKITDADVDQFLENIRKRFVSVAEWLGGFVDQVIWFVGELAKIRKKGLWHYFWDSPEGAVSPGGTAVPDLQKRPDETYEEWQKRVEPLLPKVPDNRLPHEKAWQWFWRWWQQLPPTSPEIMPPVGPVPKLGPNPSETTSPSEHWGANLPAGTTFASLPVREQFGSLEKMAGLPKGTLEAVWAAESGRGNPRWMHSPAGALGHFQFMPATWKAVMPGVNFVMGAMNLTFSAIAAARLLMRNLRASHGDIAQAIAMYNYGAVKYGGWERFLRLFGEHWKEHLPRETQEYLRKILPHLGQRPQGPEPRLPPPPAPVMPRRAAPPTVIIQVRNQTGGNAVVSASQLAV